MCVCLCWRSACTPPLLAGVCGAGVGVWAWVSAAPRHSWLGCRGVCLLVCAPRLHPATPDSGVWCGCVCLDRGFGCTPLLLARVCGGGVGVWARVSAAPRHSWLACWSVRVCVHAPPVPRHSWLGCAVWVCVLWLGFWLRPATPGWGVGVCVCWCARSPCTPPLLAVVCGVGVGVWAPVSAAPRHSWLACSDVCVLVWALPLYPATPGWGVRCGCGCLGSGFGCAPPLLAWVLGCACLCACFPCTPPLLARVCGVRVCVWVRASGTPPQPWLGCWGVCVLVCPLCLSPDTPSWGVRCGCACLGSGFRCSPPLLAGVLGCVCAGVRASLVPRHSCLGCAAWVCAFGLRVRLRPATPGWGVRLCVCWCPRFACTPPLLPGVCGVGVCVWAQGSAVPRHSWLGC